MPTTEDNGRGYTAGPYRVVASRSDANPNCGDYDVMAGDFYVACNCRKADAHLLASALDLLEACKALDESAPLDSEWGTCGCCGKASRHEGDCAVFLARAAIAKAVSP